MPQEARRRCHSLAATRASWTSAATTVGDLIVSVADKLARADFAEALTVARAVGDPLVLGYVQAHYGALLRLDGGLDQARKLHQETLTIARSSGARLLTPRRGDFPDRRHDVRVRAAPAQVAAGELANLCVGSGPALRQ